MGDEDLYKAALLEFDSGSADEALLAKAWVNANGEESRKKVEYIKLRVSQMKSAKIKLTIHAAGSAAKAVAPGIVGLAVFLGKAVALIFTAVVGVEFLSQMTGERNFGNIVGSVLAGLLVIYLISKLIEWAFLKRTVKDHTNMVVVSAIVSFLLIFALWYAGKGKPYAASPDLLSSFLLASFLLAVGRHLFRETGEGS